MNGSNISRDGGTYHGHVPSWEIDINDHWNTMYYLRSFHQAAEAFAAGGAVAVWVRHVRFFRELRAAESMMVRSVRLSPALAPYSVGHQLLHGETGTLCATALDLWEGQPHVAGADAMDEGMAPRSLAVGPHDVSDTVVELARGRAVLSHVGILSAADFDSRGTLTMAAVHSRISDGTGHLWAHIGVGPDDFYRNGMGRALVEMKMTMGATSRSGDAVRLVSWFGTPGGRTVELHHQLEDLRSGQMLACVSGTLLVLDMASRRSCAMPPFLAEAISHGRTAPASAAR